MANRSLPLSWYYRSLPPPSFYSPECCLSQNGQCTSDRAVSLHGQVVLGDLPHVLDDPFDEVFAPIPVGRGLHPSVEDQHVCRAL